MNKRKSLLGKSSNMTIISLGIIILGIGFIFLGIFSMSNDPDYSITKIRDINLNKTIEKDVVELDYEVVATVEEVLYPVYPVEGDNIGSFIIPSLDLEMPIFQGTGDKELKKGIGHFIQSVLPGESDNSVLSGHRETAFRKIGDLVIGDIIIVETSAGIFTYEVSGTRIVDKDDKTVIVPTDHGVLTMSTCYPFNYLGPAPDRYIVSADLLIID